MKLRSNKSLHECQVAWSTARSRLLRPLEGNFTHLLTQHVLAALQWIITAHGSRYKVINDNQYPCPPGAVGGEPELKRGKYLNQS